MMGHRHAWLFCAVATRAGLLELGGQLGLELLEREGAESPWAGISMRDADGKAFVCRSGSPAAREEEPGPKTLAEALGQLDGSCAYLNQGWWTYEWCHRRHVRQFHLEAQARSPEWSLGDYTRTELEDDDGGAASSVDAAGSEALSRAVDVFDVADVVGVVGGQRLELVAEEVEVLVDEAVVGAAVGAAAADDLVEPSDVEGADLREVPFPGRLVLRRRVQHERLLGLDERLRLGVLVDVRRDVAVDVVHESWLTFWALS